MGVLDDALHEWVLDAAADEADAKSGKSSTRRELEAATRDQLSQGADALGNITGIQAFKDYSDRQDKASARLRSRSTYTQSWDDVNDISSGASYVGKLALNTIPTIATMVGGGVAGARLAARGITTAAEAAKAATAGRYAGAFAAQELPSVGQVQQAQEEQSGKVDLPSSIALGTANNLLNFAGVEGAAVRGVPKSGLLSRGGRALSTAARTAAEESAAEVGQQFTEELGRKAVDDNYDVLNPEAVKRYKESAIGGALLGGAAGGVAGAVQRKPTATQLIEQEAQAARETPETAEPLQLTYQPRGKRPTPEGPAVDVYKDGVAVVKGTEIPNTATAGMRPDAVVDEDFFTGSTLQTLRPADGDAAITRTVRAGGSLDKFTRTLADGLKGFLAKSDPVGAEAFLANAAEKVETNEKLTPARIERYTKSLAAAGDIVAAYRLRYDTLRAPEEARSDDLARLAQQGFERRQPGANVTLPPINQQQSIETAGTPADAPQPATAESGNQNEYRQTLLAEALKTKNPAATFKALLKTKYADPKMHELFSNERDALVDHQLATINNDQIANTTNAVADLSSEIQEDAKVGALEDPTGGLQALVKEKPPKVTQPKPKAPNVNKAPGPAQPELALKPKLGRKYEKQAKRAEGQSLIRKAVTGELAVEMPKVAEQEVEGQLALFDDTGAPSPDVNAATRDRAARLGGVMSQGVMNDAKALEKKGGDPAKLAAVYRALIERKVPAARKILELEKKRVADSKAVAKAAEKTAARAAPAPTEDVAVTKLPKPATKPSEPIAPPRGQFFDANGLKSQIEKRLDDGRLTLADAARMRDMVDTNKEANLRKVESELFPTDPDTDTATKFSPGTQVAGDAVTIVQDAMRNPLIPRARQVLSALNDSVRDNPDFSPLAARRIVDLVNKNKYDQAQRMYEGQLYYQKKAPAPVERPAMSVADVQAIVNRVTKNWVNLPDIEVVDSENPKNDFERSVKRSAAARGLGAYGGVTKLRNNKAVILLNVRGLTPDIVEAVIYHEALGHFGLAQAYRARMDNILRDIYNSNPEVRQSVRDRVGREPTAEERLYHTEEQLAEMSEGGPLAKPGILQRVLDAVRGFARRMGWRKGVYTVDEIRSIVRKGQRAVINKLPPDETIEEAVFADAAFAPGADTRAAQQNNRGSSPRLRSDRIRESLERKGAPKWAVSAAITADDLTRKHLQGMMFGRDLVDYAESKGIPEYRAYHRLQETMQATADAYNRRLEQILVVGERLKDKDKLNTYLREATIAGEWGYVPDWDKSVVVTKAAREKFEALSPEAREVAKTVFQFSHDSRTALQKAVTDYINGDADADVKASLTQEEIDQVEKRRARQLKMFDKSIPKLTGPYAPLMRFGDYVAVAKSKEFVELENAERRSEADNARLEEMRADPDHLAVFFRETAGQAAAKKEELLSTGKFDTAYDTTRVQMFNQLGPSPLFEMQKLNLMVKDQLGETDAFDRSTTRKIEDMLKDLYISTLADNSARKHDARRKNIAGADDNMLKALSAKGRADAHYLAQMKNRLELNVLLQSIIKKAKTKDALLQERSSLVKEITARHVGAMQRDETPFQDKAMAISSFFHLATSPRYYLQNLMQPGMVTAPVLAGRHGGLSRAWGALLDGYKAVAPLTQTPDFWAGEFDVNALGLGADQTAMLKRAQQHGLLSIGMAYDAGHWDATTRGGKLMAEVTHFFRTKSGQVEVVNRVSSALASYNLGRADGMTHEQAMDYAEQIVSTTQFDYSSTNAPRYFNMLPKIVTQFRKYQVGQISLLARLLSNATVGETQEEKYVARKVLGYMFAQLGLVSGLVGLPAAQLVGVLGSALFRDEDEPLDGERWLTELTGNSEFGKLLLRGVPSAAGFEMSSVGLGTILNPLPFTDYTQLATQEGLADAALAAVGPIGGVAQKWARAADYLAQGDFMKAAINGSPSGVGYALKAYDQSQRGLTKKNGDMLLSPEEISYTNKALQALGFPPTTVLDAQRLSAQRQEFEDYYKGRTAAVKYAYTQAVKADDIAGVTEARETWQQLQEAKKRAGFKPAPMSDLLSAPAQQRKRERNTVAGVQVKASNRQFVEENAGL